ncbi:MAG: DUF839 domain-containing protein [Gammaproteobacteria bacterium]|nr:DUF839 domain-containing protein [Gammaproteobacteria bacterium]
MLAASAAPLVFNTHIARAAPVLQPTVDATTGLPLLKLPAGFSYSSMSWSGDPMSDGNAVPDRHDGMAVVPGALPNEVVLLRNHERYGGTPIAGDKVPVYDEFSMPLSVARRLGSSLNMAGGVTGVVLRDDEYAETVPLIGGTMINCAGGVTPWGTWLTCEETLLRGSNIDLAEGGSAKDHGYVFEVPPPHMGPASAVPIKDMGFFRHEAAAIDPNTGYGYLTEDNGPHSGFYRFIPHNLEGKLGSLDEGGALSMLKVKGMDNRNLTADIEGSAYDVEWIAIEDPDADPEILNSYGNGLENVGGQGKSGPFLQGEAQGAARFSRGEGIWEYDGRIYWIDTAGGPAGAGSVWLYDPTVERLVCIFASASEVEADAIDNIAIRPTDGMIILCEDGGGVQGPDGEFLIGARLLVSKQPGHDVIAFAENNTDLRNGVPGRSAIPANDYRTGEWAGATFSADGETLYANLQNPGITVAIRGPWASL